jgi:hypothetical protein
MKKNILGLHVTGLMLIPRLQRRSRHREKACSIMFFRVHCNLFLYLLSSYKVHVQ